MLIFKVLGWYLILSFLKFQAAKGDQVQQTFPFQLPNCAQKIELKIDTKLKEEFIKSSDTLAELIKNEFRKRDEQYANLVKTNEAQNQELNKIKQQLSQQKENYKNFIEIYLPATLEKMRENAKKLLEETCSKEFLKTKATISELLNEKFESQTKSQKALVEKSLKTLKLVQPLIDSSRWNKNFDCIKNCGPIMDLPQSCAAAVSPIGPQDGVYLLNVKRSGLKPFFAYCKTIENEVWMVIQRREDGSENFNRNWSDYKLGFGNLYGEFWLGLERFHALTKLRKHQLHIWLENSAGLTRWARYAEFSIGNETEKYKLAVSNRTGNLNSNLEVKDQFRHNGMKFSTKDECNDNHNGSTSCAVGYESGWWFNKCYRVNLNGLYSPSGEDGIDWNGFGKKLKYTQMAIREV